MCVMTYLTPYVDMFLSLKVCVYIVCVCVCNKTTVTRKQKWEEKQVYGYFKW